MAYVPLADRFIYECKNQWLEGTFHELRIAYFSRTRRDSLFSKIFP